jgi:hypothetical protein
VLARFLRRHATSTTHASALAIEVCRTPGIATLQPLEVFSVSAADGGGSLAHSGARGFDSAATPIHGTSSHLGG